MYLLHMGSIHGAHQVTMGLGVASPAVDFVAGSMLALGLATTSYLTLEKYFLRLKERWFSERPAAGRPPAWTRIPVIGSLLS
jgi:peptidoglycan/LPS O-acetylase OafA/YrhL